MSGKKALPQREDILRQLGKLAFGKANDCVELALRDDADLKKLDLNLLTGVKKGKDGSVEVRIVDRLQALKDLADLVGNSQDGAQEFLQALCQSDEED